MVPIGCRSYLALIKVDDMMRTTMFRSFVSIVAILTASACGVLRPAEPSVVHERTAQTNITKPLGDDEVLGRITALPAQTLEDGTCGLFLWLRRDDAPLIFFQRSDVSDALMILDGVVQSLPRQTAENPIAFNFFETQTFENTMFSLSVKVKAEAVRSIRQGVKIETGTISITTDDGWSASLPVAGVIGCK